MDWHLKANWIVYHVTTFGCGMNIDHAMIYVSWVYVVDISLSQIVNGYQFNRNTYINTKNLQASTFSVKHNH